MKRWKKEDLIRSRILLGLSGLFLLIGLVVSLVVKPVSAMDANTSVKTNTSDMHGMWVSYSDFKDLGFYNKKKGTFQKNADKFFKQLKANQINTVFFHVVPCNDSIYPSKYLDYSSSMFAKDPNYDALEILIEVAHANGIAFHAWINPYRKNMNGKIYNPQKKASTTRILRIIKELTRNYEIDGVHFDDYFYPSKTKGNDYYKVSIKKRKKYVNRMVKSVYKTLKKLDANIIFSISPAGNIEYAKSLGCDLKTWLSKDGYVDLIIPQIYWSENYRVGGKRVNMYKDRLLQWVDLNKNNTPMMIGLGFYRAGVGDYCDLGWKKRNDNLVRQIKLLRKNQCQGYVLFTARFLNEKNARKELKNYNKYLSELRTETWKKIESNP